MGHLTNYRMKCGLPRGTMIVDGPVSGDIVAIARGALYCGCWFDKFGRKD